MCTPILDKSSNHFIISCVFQQSWLNQAFRCAFVFKSQYINHSLYFYKIKLQIRSWMFITKMQCPCVRLYKHTTVGSMHCTPIFVFGCNPLWMCAGKIRNWNSKTRTTTTAIGPCSTGHIYMTYDCQQRLFFFNILHYFFVNSLCIRRMYIVFYCEHFFKEGKKGKNCVNSVGK